MATSFQQELTNMTVKGTAGFTKGLNKGLLDVIFGDQAGTAAPSAGSTGSRALPSGPAVATLIDTIQVVEDGDVIRAEQHNDLVGAVRLIARLLDTGQIAQEITVSAAPVLLPPVRGRGSPVLAGRSAAIMLCVRHAVALDASPYD